MRALVTGGSGFIGSHVVDKLRDKGIEVRVFDLAIPTYRKDIEHYQASLLDFDALRFALGGVDAIFHLGAIADVKDVYQEPHYAEAINVRGTINVLEAAKRNGSVKRVIFGSTTWVYGDTVGNILDEDTPLSGPSHIYTATKMAGEYYCQCYSRLYDLPTTILRYGIPYGPRAREGAVVPNFVKKALNGESLTIAGDGLQYRKFIYVEDLADGNVLALKEIAKNKIYNLEGKEKVSIRQIAETIQKILGKVEIKYVEGRPGDFSGKEIIANRAREELGWEPRVSFEEGVGRYIEWFKDNQKTRDAEWADLEEKLS
ncbi:NAD-dependent epimerase/dehydratase family protein [Chloroflexota bacterium]